MRGETQRPGLVSCKAHDTVLLLDAEPRLLVESAVENLLGKLTEVRTVRLSELDV